MNDYINPLISNPRQVHLDVIKCKHCYIVTYIVLMATNVL